MKIGFSTGSLAYGDFQKAFNMQKGLGVNAIELSALREDELEPLVAALETLDLSMFEYISFHAPSKLAGHTETQLIETLLHVTEKNINIIVHPDIIVDPTEWRIFGDHLCIENMDNRKRIGQTTADLSFIFDILPEASMCFDIAHAKQIDGTMAEAIAMARKFSSRIKQYHISEVNALSAHEPLTLRVILLYNKLVPYLDKNIPVIIESPVLEEGMQREIKMVETIFDEEKLLTYINEQKK